MVEVLLSRTLQGQNVGEAARLLQRMRCKDMRQPGYISGETPHKVDNPNLCPVIGTRESLGHRQAWRRSRQRQKLQGEVGGCLQSPLKVRGFTY